MFFDGKHDPNSLGMDILISSLPLVNGPGCQYLFPILFQELSTNPQFIVGGATRTDICQGALGKAGSAYVIYSLQKLT